MSLRAHDFDDDLEENHEINVTPFIDVMLVLLIVFMVAAPLATVDVAVELPASTAQAQPRDEQPVYLSVREDLSLDLNGDAVASADLAAALNRATQGDRERRIFLRADRRVPYGELMQAMNGLRDAGYLKVALVATESAHE